MIMLIFFLLEFRTVSWRFAKRRRFIWLDNKSYM